MAERLSVRVFRAALRILPPAVRRQYGAEMESDARRILRSAAERGRMREVAVLLRATGDVLRRAPAEWLATRPRREEGSGSGGADVRQELRIAARGLRRRPGFALAALATLGLGMGGTLAIWTVVESVLLRPLPYPESERLVTVVHHAPGIDVPELQNSAGTLQLYGERARTLSSVAGTELEQRNLTDPESPARVWVYRVTEPFFDAVRMEPAMGRRFLPEDAGPGPERVAILTDGAWRQRFGAAPDIVGRSISLNGQPIEIIGVMPAGFIAPTSGTREGRANPDLLLPFHLDPLLNRAFGSEVVARLAPGQSLASAQAELTALQAALVESNAGFTDDFRAAAGWSVEVIALLDQTVGDVRASLWMLFAMVQLLLLIAGANVANLMLVRGESRRREVSIRSALGGGRLRIAGMFLSESLLLAAGGAVLGTGIAALAVRALAGFGPRTLPRLAEVRMDGSVALVAVALALLAGVVLAAGPALRAMRALDSEALRSGSLRTTDGRERHRVRNALLVMQVALALVLLVGSGLLLRSFARLRAVDPGVASENVIAIGVSRVPGAEGDDEAVRFYQGVVDEVAALPGVDRVGATSSLPFLVDGINGSNFRIRSRPGEEGELPPVVWFATVLPGYFETVGMRLVAGRLPERADHEDRRQVAWVNETFARRLLDGSAVGESIRIGADTTWLDIAGVVSDVRTFDLDEEVRPEVYLPPTTTVSGTTKDMMHIVVHHSGERAGLIDATRAIVRRLDPAVPVTTVRTMDSLIARSMERRSFVLVLLSLAASIALVLGVVGLYGAIAYVVAQRTREIGVRIALGADAGQVSRMVMRQGLAVVAAGIAAGLLAAAMLTRFMEALLFEVRTSDPVTFLAMPLVLLAVGALAAWVPARRASRVSPREALRAE